MRKLRKRDAENLQPWYEFRAQADETTAELRIFGPIGGGFFFDEDAVSAKDVIEQLDALDDSVTTIRVLVDSPGGSVFDAVHIANALKRQRDEFSRNVEVDVEALAASAATIITSAGDPVRMPRNALMMIHNPWGMAVGDASLMREMADVLDKVRNQIVATYQWITSLAPKAIQDLMDATTWMDADEAVASGFATEITDAVAVAASLDADALEELPEIPEKYRDRVMALAETDDEEDDDSADDEPDEPDEPTADDEPGARASVDNPSEGKMTDTEKKQAEAEARKAERARNHAIRAAAAVAVRAGLDQDKADAIMAESLGDDEHEGLSANAAREKFFDALAEKSDATGPKPGQTVDIVPGEDASDKRVAGISAALWNRAGVTGLLQAAAKKAPDDPRFQNLDLDGREFRGRSLYDFARDDLERMQPGASKGHTRMEVAGAFFNAVGQQTTSDYAVALENTMHKILEAAYMIAPDTWRRFCGVGSVSDFRTHNRYRTGYFSSLDQIYESGEFTNKSIPDAVKETISALTYGNILALSRQAIINDDMGVFSRVASQVGRAAALTIESAVYSLLGQNSGLGPAMNDTDPLFDANHSNLGTGAAISVASIEADRVVLGSQQDPNSQEYLDIRPAVLLVPIGLGGQARVINESQYDVDSGKVTNTPNKVVGLFADIVDTPRLSGTRRYMFADPATMPVIEVAFLEGEQMPYMEMKDGWRTDGVEWKVRHDFGVAAVEFRGAVTNAGQ